MEALIGFWGKEDHRNILTLPPKRLCEDSRLQSGMPAWLALRWYPTLLLFYAAGIAAVAANKSDNLYELMLPSVEDPECFERKPLVVAIGSATRALHDVFKALPDYAQKRHPRSEYLYVFFQPVFDDLFLLGSDYDSAFDCFELLIALEHAFVTSEGGRVWGPPGRFAWKFRQGSRSNPIAAILAESQAGAQWGILKAGFFGGSLEKFKEIMTQYRQSLGNYGW